MPLDSTSVQRIRASFDLLAPRGNELIDEFYTRLFRTAPGVRSLFPQDMTQQKKHLLSAVALVVKNADKLETLEKPLQEMGARHVVYGAKKEHYAVVRDTMLETIGSLAGPAWTPELKADWTAALNAVAGAMIRGAESFEKKAA
ncbi:MAG: hypothetical protein IBJ18_13120 [Phycisphaerales bacterium]|nr:hypothetical protein [Phycisphaerales bacterium]